jgi:Ca2+-binding EF-hand superfamily protein
MGVLCVQEWLTQIFVAADTDNNGSLDRDEFKMLMKELNLSEREALQV